MTSAGRKHEIIDGERDAAFGMSVAQFSELRNSPRVRNRLDLELAKRLLRSSLLYPFLAVMQLLCFVYFDVLQTWQLGALGFVSLFSILRYFAARQLMGIAKSSPFALQREAGFGRLPAVLKSLSLGIAMLWSVIFSEVFYRERMSGSLTLICFLQTVGFSVGATVALGSTRRTALLFQSIFLVPLAFMSLWLAYSAELPQLYTVAFMAAIQFAYTSQFTMITGRDQVDAIVYQESLRLSNQELAESQKRLAQESEKAYQSSLLASLGRMAGGVAHEINNPLTIAMGNIRQISSLGLSKGATSAQFEKLNHKLARVDVALQRMAKVVGSLMVFIRQESSSRIEPLDVRELVTTVLTNCQSEQDQLKVTVELEIPDHAVLVACQSQQITEVIESLVGNALEALEGRERRLLRVRVSVTLESAIIWVEDSGPGLLPGSADKIFDPFFTTKPVGQGTGLGLAVSRALALSNGGSLEHVPGREMTTFVLRLPRVLAHVGSSEDSLPTQKAG